GLGQLGGEVGPGIEVAGAPGALIERDEPEQLVAAGGPRHRRYIGPGGVCAIGEPGDVARLAEVLALGVDLKAGRPEVTRQGVRPAAVGERLLGRLGGEAYD